MQIVISQSMLFPWIGLMEQIRLADVFVHYNDVQFSKGSFVNRVQIKTSQGPKWMTVPLENVHLGQRINEVKPKAPGEWRSSHMGLLKNSFAGTSHANDALSIADDVFSGEYANIGELARASMLAVAKYFELDLSTRFVDVEQLNISGTGSNRVLAIAEHFEASRYVTGHGAAQYLDHHAFEEKHVQVEYMDYRRLPYPQMHGPFNPYVTGLDLVANCGRAGINYICSGTKPWREFLNESARSI
ncbi:MAG: WbqC family protein [Arenimonas sp.]